MLLPCTGSVPCRQGNSDPGLLTRHHLLDPDLLSSHKAPGTPSRHKGRCCERGSQGCCPLGNSNSVTRWGTLRKIRKKEMSTCTPHLLEGVLGSGGTLRWVFLDLDLPSCLERELQTPRIVENTVSKNAMPLREPQRPLLQSL